MAKTATPRAQPVTVTFKPFVTCQLCRRPFVHDRVPGAAAKVLTEHYNSDHTAEEMATLR